MRDELISFVTAKLAKEKGFNENCNYKYRKGGTLSDGKGFLSNLDIYESPTQSLLQKWFREEHDIHVLINVDQKDGIAIFSWIIFQPYKKYTPSVNGDVVDYDTYEQALEIGLREALKLI